MEKKLTLIVTEGKKGLRVAAEGNGFSDLERIGIFELLKNNTISQFKQEVNKVKDGK